MIPGNYYIGADIVLTCETEVDLSAQTELKVNVKLPDGTLKQYDGTVVNFTQVTATFPSADNMLPGEITIQVQVTTPTYGTEFSSTDNLFILQSYAPT